MTKYIKPLFHIQKTHINDLAYQGARFYYELYYKIDNVYHNVGGTCFFSIQAAREMMDNLLELNE